MNAIVFSEMTYLVAHVPYMESERVDGETIDV